VCCRLRASNPYWGSGIGKRRRHHKIVNFFCVCKRKVGDIVLRLRARLLLSVMLDMDVLRAVGCGQW